MEMKKITKEMREQLRYPLPPDAIKPHPTKTYLSSIKAIYVTERLNDVFGVGSWTTKLHHIVTAHNSMVVIKVDFAIPEYGVYYECYGGNDNGGENSKNFDLGDAYKGATTDALTKIASFLEIGIDVFKGKQNTPQPPKDNEKQKQITWLTEEQYNATLAADIKGIEAVLKKYSGEGFGIKKDWKNALEIKLKMLKDGK